MASQSEPVRIIVEIIRAEPFRGTIAEPGQPVQGFNGWTAFAAAIAVVVRRIDAPTAPEDEPNGVAGG